jgi:molecular chaperone HscC
MIVGIDLGTTNSLIGVFRDGTAQLITNSLGHLLTPSVVSVDENGNVIVGLAARERLGSHPESTASGFKRWMGTDKIISLGKRRFRAEELSALVLKALKSDAEAHLSVPIEEAIITVPAYFNDAQRKATKAAGELAGLRVERLLNEPTAAGLAYGIEARPNNTTFLVFDLGGGTFDVSVLEYFDGIVEVRASVGDTRLGGDDFTHAISKLLQKKYPSVAPVGSTPEFGDAALWRISEQIKRDLSDSAVASQSITNNNEKNDVSITREEFESASKELLDRLRRPIERALLDAQINVKDLSEIVLVGGSTRMPAVRQLAARLFQRLPLRTIDPDETVARGAAIQAAMKARYEALDEIVLTDVMPYSLGVITSDFINGRLVHNRFSPMIERNTPIPVSRVSVFNTIHANQKEILLDIRQGESPIGTENLRLGELGVTVTPMPAGEAKVEVRFSYDANGLLIVDAKDMQHGESTSTVINHSANVMTPSQIEAAVKQLAALKVHPRDKQENIYLAERAKRLYGDFLGEARLHVQMLLSTFEAALDTQDEQIIRRARESFKKQIDELDTGFTL